MDSFQSTANAQFYLQVVAQKRFQITRVIISG